MRQLGDALQKQLKGKPVGETLGRILGSVRIGKNRGNRGPADDEQGLPRGQAKPDAEEEAPPERATKAATRTWTISSARRGRRLAGAWLAGGAKS